MSVKINQRIDIDFLLPVTESSLLKFSELTGQKIVFYFYPKDNTSGCTLQGQQFRDLYPQFLLHNTRVFGISRDTLTSHKKFKDKQNFPFDLISDADETLCQYFDVIKMKNMYGKKVRGIERSTFLFDEKTILKYEWRKVKADGNAQEVLNVIMNMK